MDTRTTINTALANLLDRMERDTGAATRYLAGLSELVSDREVWPAAVRTIDGPTRQRLALMLVRLTSLSDSLVMVTAIGTQSA